MVIKDWENQLDDKEFLTMCQSAKEIISSKNNDFRQIVRADIFPMKEEWYLTMEGMFDVYKWENQKWVNQYKAKFWGYNFASLKFINDGSLYSFGGNGFWKTHGEIIKFYTHVNEWDILPVTALLPFGLGLPGYQELFILRQDSISIFDIKNEKVNTSFLPNFHDSIPYFANKKVIESKNYTLVVNFNQILLDKRNRSIHQLARGAFIFILGSDDGFYHVVGDSIIIYNNKLEFEMAEIINADFHRYQQVFPVDMREVKKTQAGLNYFIIGFVLIFIIAGVYFFYFKKRHVPAAQEDFQELLERVLRNAGKTLSSEELDETLNIPDYLTPENLRYKRSKLVNELNGMYKIKHSSELITRIKDPADKRKFFYRINA